MSSLFWGVLGIFLTRVLHGPIEEFIFGVPGQVKVFSVLVITAILAGDFALSFRDALELREVLIDIEKMEGMLKGMEVQQLNVLKPQQGAAEELIKIEKFLEKLENIRNGIQAQLSARYEVKIR